MEYVDLRPVVNDAQGKVWAVAPMLPEGSQSWSMRLVGGADLDGADTRATQYGVKRGNLVLADNHYGMYGFDAPGNFLWTQQGADDIGMPWLAGTVIDEQFIIDNFGYPSAALMCDVPDYCKAKDPGLSGGSRDRALQRAAHRHRRPGPAGRRRPAHAFAVRRLYRRRLVGRHPGRRPVQPAAPEGPGRHGDERSQPGLRAPSTAARKASTAPGIRTAAAT